MAGCDIDLRMIARARARAASQGAVIDYAIADAELLPFLSESFDIVTIITVLAFVPQPERALREIARVLRPGGRVVIGDLGKWSLWAASRRIRGWTGLAPMWNTARFPVGRRAATAREGGPAPRRSYLGSGLLSPLPRDRAADSADGSMARRTDHLWRWFSRRSSQQDLQGSSRRMTFWSSFPR